MAVAFDDSSAGCSNGSGSAGVGPSPVADLGAVASVKRLLWWVQLLRATVVAVAGRFTTQGMGVSLASALVKELAAIEHSVAAMKAKAAAVVAESSAWRDAGERSPAHHLARQTGSSVGEAAKTLQTGKRLENQAGVDKASSSGELSSAQTALIARAVEADPRAERRLIELAPRVSLGELTRECDRVIAAADADAEARRKRIHAGRFASRHRKADGGERLVYESTPGLMPRTTRTTLATRKQRMPLATRMPRMPLTTRVPLTTRMPRIVKPTSTATRATSARETRVSRATAAQMPAPMASRTATACTWATATAALTRAAGSAATQRVSASATAESAGVDEGRPQTR